MIKKLFLFVSCLFFVSVTTFAWSEPTNIIFFIGDGMGFEQVKAAGMYYNGSEGTLLFETFPYQAEMTTHSADSSITDSAASTTAIATGIKVNNGVISTAIPGDGSELHTLLEYFRDKGKKTGLVTTSFITHATPAAFGAHELSRFYYYDIAQDYLYQTQPNVMFGGGSNGISIEDAVSAGYTVVTDYNDMQSLNTETATMVSGQFGTTNMPYEYDYFIGIDNGYDTLPQLSEMTATALDILDNAPDGFFLMVEGGRIDHAGEANEIERNIFETIEFTNSIQIVMDWAQGRSDTLILVTADHEAGGLTVIKNNGQGVSPDVSWTTTGHTSANVPVYAWGVNAELVSGVMDNTDLFEVATSNIPKISVSPSSIDFGSIDVGSDKDMMFNVENTGYGTLSGNASIPSSSPFSIVSGSSYSLTHGQTHLVTVRFSPVFTGTFNESVSFTGAGGTSVSVSGEGTVSVMAPIISSISNQSTIEGSPYNGQIPVLIQGTQPVTWSLTNWQSGMSINTITGQVFWSNPTTNGSPYTITIQAINSAGSDTETWQLTVTSIPGGPDIEIIDPIGSANDLQIPFGDITESISSEPEIVVISNTGTADLIVSNIKLTGSDAAEFDFDVNGGANPCAGTAFNIMAGDSCTVTITFSPTSTGPKSADLAITSDDPDENTVIVAVSGTGLSAVVNNPPTAPVLIYPGSNQIDLGTSIDFSWNESTDPDGDFVTYNLYVCEDENFTGCIPYENIAFLENKGIYYAGTGSGLLLFGIVFTGSVKGRKKLALLMAVIMIAATFFIACGSGGGGGSANVSGNNPSPPPSGDITYKVSGLFSGTIYYWKVVADDGNGSTKDSTVRSFITQ